MANNNEPEVKISKQLLESSIGHIEAWLVESQRKINTLLSNLNGVDWQQLREECDYQIKYREVLSAYRFILGSSKS